jgi:hypothetical protein
MNITKDTLLGYKGPAPTPVDVPQLGGQVFLRVMSGTERDAFESESYKVNGKSVELNRANFRARLLVKCLADEAGVRMLADDDAAALGKLPADLLDVLATKASAINGMSAKDCEDLAKNS